jgi:hypothetical protein
MRLLDRGWQSLAGEARRLLADIRDWRLVLLLGCLATLLLLAAQAPIQYSIEVGQADGPGSDLPLLAGFFAPERDTHGTFRWTSARSLIQLPGVGRRDLQMTLRVFPVSAEVVERGPRELEVWSASRLLLRLPVLSQGATYHFLVPSTAYGDQLIELRSATFTPSGDQRSIGVPVDAVHVSSAGGPLLPAWRSTLGWLLAALLAWAAVRRAGFEPSAALALLLPPALLAGLAALLDPPRFAMGVAPAIVALVIGWLLILLLTADVAALLLGGILVAFVAAATARASFSGPIGVGAALAAGASALIVAALTRPRMAALVQRLGVEMAPRAWSWVLLTAWLVLVLRYGGKIYPDSMPGDIGFHSNRYDALVRGSVLQLSLNRGVFFPYPPALYVLLAPFSLLGLPQRVLLQLGGALFDALSPLLVYVLAVRLWPGSRSRANATALLAAALYSFSAAGFMTTWWNFSTHIFAQFAHLLLIAALVLLWPKAGDDGWQSENRRARIGASLSSLSYPRSSIFAALVVLQSLVYVGHFGFWINMTLLWGIAVALLLAAVWFGRLAWPIARFALVCWLTAEALAGLLFYSDYAGLFVEQIRATLNGGLTGLAGRPAVDRTILWRTLWDAGLRTHFGFFPLPLALGGLLLAIRAKNREPRTRQSRPVLGSRFLVLVLMGGTFAIGSVFAVLPFLSGSTLSTRWLMFSAWAVAVGAAQNLRAFWSRGRAARLMTLSLFGYVFWIAASVWLMALAWRVRPPEPF